MGVTTAVWRVFDMPCQRWWSLRSTPLESRNFFFHAHSFSNFFGIGLDIVSNMCAVFSLVKAVHKLGLLWLSDIGNVFIFTELLSELHWKTASKAECFSLLQGVHQCGGSHSILPKLCVWHVPVQWAAACAVWPASSLHRRMPACWS